MRSLLRLIEQRLNWRRQTLHQSATNPLNSRSSSPEWFDDIDTVRLMISLTPLANSRASSQPREQEDPWQRSSMRTMVAVPQPD